MGNPCDLLRINDRLTKSGEILFAEPAKEPGQALHTIIVEELRNQDEERFAALEKGVEEFFSEIFQTFSGQVAQLGTLAKYVLILHGEFNTILVEHSNQIHSKTGR